jgi:DNA repair protein RadC
MNTQTTVSPAPRARRSKPPREFKVLSLRESPSPIMRVDTPADIAAYWHANIPLADWYDPCKEACVVLVLNTRHRILGHNLVSLGTLDGVSIRPLDVFRPAFALAG